MIRQRPECREEHFVRTKLRGQNSLQDQSFDQRVNDTDQVLRRHREFVLSESTQPFRAKLVTASSDLVNSRAQVGAGQRVSYSR